MWRFYIITRYISPLTHWGRASVIKPSLVQITACCMTGAKPLSEPVLGYSDWTLRNKLQWNFNRNSNIFIQEHTFENVVCEMACILSRPQCVKGKADLARFMLAKIDAIESDCNTYILSINDIYIFTYYDTIIYRLAVHIKGALLRLIKARSAQNRRLSPKSSQ